VGYSDKMQELHFATKPLQLWQSCLVMEMLPMRSTSKYDI
jgi:hypothetical protein